jgi:flagellar L-ring protein FlgH
VSALLLAMALGLARADEASPPGSLWSEPAARALTGMDGNARRVGDLITVVISESTQTELTADTQTSRSSAVGAGVDALFGLENSLGKRASLSLGADSSASFAGTGETRAAGSLSGRLTCEVVSVLPNGNLVIQGSKDVRSNREVQRLVLEGVVRPRDIRMDNTVESELMANARIEFAGAGVVSDKQGPGVGQRVLDHALPF